MTEAFPDTKFPRRMWLYFRLGHGQYLLYAMSFSNFILIFYRMAIERVPTLEAIFSSITFFVSVFIPIYVIVAILIGRWHIRTQMETQQVVNALYNPPLKKILKNQEEILKRLIEFEEERSGKS